MCLVLLPDATDAHSKTVGEMSEFCMDGYYGMDALQKGINDMNCEDNSALSGSVNLGSDGCFLSWSVFLGCFTKASTIWTESAVVLVEEVRTSVAKAVPLMVCFPWLLYRAHRWYGLREQWSSARKCHPRLQWSLFGGLFSFHGLSSLLIYFPLRSWYLKPQGHYQPCLDAEGIVD